ncbi:hypothetical protein Poly30_52880 [Planctomycetes bacterium Poly30]|uniref:DUF1579 domain-containing protein n=1 Tax=Saltatorellus ferox TaxID=2528018 RepID=A0A518F077_9BACT|nr:hypothetical protein Poly30_52880 [Planctomycetes bacterium Poly30]
MKKLLPLLLLASCSATGPANGTAAGDRADQATAASSFAAMPPTADLHPYLQRLLGDWRIRSEVGGGSDGATMVMESTESVEAMGPWIVSRIRAGGEPGDFEARLALAYDAETDDIVGFWVDSSSSHMWNYRCWLDEGGSTLTAEAEGPAFDDPSRVTRFQDITEFDGSGRRLLRSRMLGADGEWVEFSSGVAERVR